MHKLKNRVITIRVSDDELARLKGASDRHDAKCLSDFVRTVMLGIAAGTTKIGPGETREAEELKTVYARLAAVESDLSRVLELLSFAEGVDARNQ